ncbi:MAG: alanine--glyoxylate aminotransferase family protein [Nibricoccus sp.]
MSYKLFIPGPVAVSEKTYRAMARPMIPHRSPEFVALYRSIQTGLQSLFATRDPVYLSTSSSWGVMEASLRNLTNRKVLTCMNGAFSDKWYDVAQKNGIAAGGLRFEWGQPVDPNALRRELATGQYDCVTIIHNETSTGTMSDIRALAAVLRDFPNVISIIDVVSSFSALPIPKDELGLDVMIAGSQKALALPPGLTLFTVSKRALERATSNTNRGYYFDFLEFQRNHEMGMTPTTPTIAHIYALQSKLEDIAAEGLTNRYARHARFNQTVRAWGEAKGFRLLPEEDFGSVTLNCFRNDGDLDLPRLNEILKTKHGLAIDTGYGKLKGKTFRLSNMGDETDSTIAQLLGAMDEALAELRSA